MVNTKYLWLLPVGNEGKKKGVEFSTGSKFFKTMKIWWRDDLNVTNGLERSFLQWLYRKHTLRGFPQPGVREQPWLISVHTQSSGLAGSTYVKQLQRHLLSWKWWLSQCCASPTTPGSLGSSVNRTCRHCSRDESRQLAGGSMEIQLALPALIEYYLMNFWGAENWAYDSLLGLGGSVSRKYSLLFVAEQHSASNQSYFSGQQSGPIWKGLAGVYRSCSLAVPCPQSLLQAGSQLTSCLPSCSKVRISHAPRSFSKAGGSGVSWEMWNVKAKGWMWHHNHNSCVDWGNSFKKKIFQQICLVPARGQEKSPFLHARKPGPSLSYCLSRSWWTLLFFYII